MDVKPARYSKVPLTCLATANDDVAGEMTPPPDQVARELLADIAHDAHYTCAIAANSARWDRNNLSIGRSCQRHWPRLIPFFDYPPDIRGVICTASITEPANMSLRKPAKRRFAFPSGEAPMKPPHLALRDISKKRAPPIRDQKAALKRFAIEPRGRLPPL